MRFIYQIGIILVITFIGEAFHMILPLPIPASIYGLLLMLICLRTGVVKLNKVKQAGDFLLEIMPLMFIPAAVGLIDVWDELSLMLLPILLITLSTTLIVMVVTGKMTQFILSRDSQEKI